MGSCSAPGTFWVQQLSLHFHGWCGLGMTPKWLMHTPLCWCSAPTSTTLLAATSLARYAFTTSGFCSVDSMFLLAGLQSLSFQSKPIQNPCWILCMRYRTYSLSGWRQRTADHASAWSELLTTVASGGNDPCCPSSGVLWSNCRNSGTYIYYS